MSAQARYDMAMSMINQGMTSAANSGSPTAAFLAPLAGALIGGKAQSNYDAYKKDATSDMISAMMPHGVTPETQKLFDIASNPDAPDFLRSLAQSQIKAAMSPKGTGRGRGAKSAGVVSSGRSASGEPLFGEVMGQDGILYGRTKRGSIVPYLGPDGQPFKPKQKGGAEDIPAEYTTQAGGISGAPEDPLGIRQ